jgi:hypothetical protein
VHQRDDHVCHCTPPARPSVPVIPPLACSGARITWLKLHARVLR